jgi:hypothetical protein
LLRTRGYDGGSFKFEANYEGTGEIRVGKNLSPIGTSYQKVGINFDVILKS